MRGEWFTFGEVVAVGAGRRRMRASVRLTGYGVGNGQYSFGQKDDQEPGNFFQALPVGWFGEIVIGSAGPALVDVGGVVGCAPDYFGHVVIAGILPERFENIGRVKTGHFIVKQDQQGECMVVAGPKPGEGLFAVADERDRVGRNFMLKAGAKHFLVFRIVVRKKNKWCVWLHS